MSYYRVIDEEMEVTEERQDYVQGDIDLFSGGEILELSDDKESYTSEDEEERTTVVSDEDIFLSYISDRIGSKNYCLAEMAILDKTNYKEIRDEYVVSPKLDGVRAMCVTLDGKLYSMSANSDVKVVDTKLRSGYVLDVEEIQGDKVVLDVIANPSGVTRWLPLRKRLATLDFTKDIKNRWKRQQYWNVCDIGAMYRAKEYTSLPYYTDGLVFQSSVSPYYFGFNPRIYKWKPKGDTVDLLCKKFDGEVYLWGSVNDEFHKFEKCSLDDFEDGKIYECMVHTNGNISKIKHRPDRSTPNSMSTISKILLANKHCVKKKELIRWCGKQRLRGNAFLEEVNSKNSQLSLIPRHVDRSIADYKKQIYQSDVVEGDEIVGISVSSFGEDPLAYTMWKSEQEDYDDENYRLLVQRENRIKVNNVTYRKKEDSEDDISFLGMDQIGDIT